MTGNTDSCSATIATSTPVQPIVLVLVSRNVFLNRSGDMAGHLAFHVVEEDVLEGGFVAGHVEHRQRGHLA